jgi:hypothetical protein
LVVIFKCLAFIRQDLSGGRFSAQLSAEEHLELAGLAIRAEFGEFIDLIHGGGAYFSLQHYLPEDVRYVVIFEEKGFMAWGGGVWQLNYDWSESGVDISAQVGCMRRERAE